MVNFYKELPDGYTEDLVIDAKKTSTGIIFNAVGLLISVGVYLLTLFIKFGKIFISYPDVAEDTSSMSSLLEVELPLILLVIGMFAYLFLHELTHGLAYKLLTREKLTFGFSWSCAYCGVPNLYTTKRTALISILAPFVVYSIIFIVAIILVQDQYISQLVILLFALHFGGCVGDLYGTILLLFRYKRGCLMKDTGPKQSFYVKD